MKHFLLLTTILICVLFTTGCTSVKTIVINVQKPAEITLPKSVNNIGIVNNAISQPDSLGHFEYKFNEKGERISNKITVSGEDNCTVMSETLFETLSEIDYFNKVSIYDHPLRNDLEYEKSKNIDSLEIIQLASMMDVDAIISLDQFIVYSVSHTTPTLFDVNMKYLDIKMNTRFQIYSKNGQQISPFFSFSDSIYWQAPYINELSVEEEIIPDREEAIKEAAVYVGEKLANLFIPQWTNEPRIYYGDSKKANKEVEAGNWKEALKTWQEMYNNETKTKKKARLSRNIALAYELSDNIPDALSWAEIAVSLFSENNDTAIDQANTQSAKQYYEKLMERYKEFQILDIRE